MTIIEAINAVDAVKPNSYSQDEKIAWLSRLDGNIKAEVVDTHEDGEAVVYEGYDENTPLSTQLIAPAPYDDIYIKWLEAQIDYANNEFAKYANSASAFNAAYSVYTNWYNRQHMPKTQVFKCF